LIKLVSESIASGYVFSFRLQVTSETGPPNHNWPEEQPATTV